MNPHTEEVQSSNVHTRFIATDYIGSVSNRLRYWTSRTHTSQQNMYKLKRSLGSFAPLFTKDLSGIFLTRYYRTRSILQYSSRLQYSEYPRYSTIHTYRNFSSKYRTYYRHYCRYGYGKRKIHLLECHDDASQLIET